MGLFWGEMDAGGPKQCSLKPDYSQLSVLFCFFSLSHSKTVCTRVGERRGSKARLRRSLLTILVFLSEGWLRELWQSPKELNQG